MIKRSEISFGIEMMFCAWAGAPEFLFLVLDFGTDCLLGQMDA